MIKSIQSKHWSKWLIGASISVAVAITGGCSGTSASAIPTATAKQTPAATATPAAKSKSTTKPTAKAITKPVAGKLIRAKVTRVVDGDTIHVSINGKDETVRMVLVDTPETKKPNTPVQPFGPEASAFTKEQLTGKEVLLEKDVTERDRYGRLLFYVWLGDKMFNETLIEKGLARVAVFQPDVKYVEHFRELQKKAQQARLGIWSIEDYATDKGYDAEVASSKSSSAPNSSSSKNNEVYYKNCSAVRAAGKAPLHREDPGYRKGLDGDGDGDACE